MRIGAHIMFTNTISDVRASMVSESSAEGLEVDSFIYFGEVTTCQTSRASHEIGECGRSRHRRDLQGEGFLPFFQKFPTKRCSTLSLNAAMVSPSIKISQWG